MRMAAWAAIAAALGGGCIQGAGASAGAEATPVARFPSRGDLQKVAVRPATPEARPDMAPADHWSIKTAIPAPGSAYPNVSASDRMLAELRKGQSSPARLAPELRCAGEETARFYVEKGAYPEDALRQYLLLRCGSTLATESVQMLSTTASDAIPQTTLDAGLAPSARQLAMRLLESGTEVGIGFARGHGRAALVGFSGTALGRLGEVAPDAVAAIGFANQGALGVARCEPDLSVTLPSFRLSCPFAADDAQTRIEISTRRTGQVLVHQSLQLLVRRTTDAGLEYEARPYGAVESAPSPEAFRRALVAGLNEARRDAGARPLALEENESRDSDQLIAQFFDSSLHGHDEDADTVALGLLAGWDVGGAIRDGGFFSAIAAGSRSPGRWLTEALGSPLGRWSLLDANRARVAIGSALVAPMGAMALVTTYAFFESSDHRADEDAVFEGLARARKARGVAPPTRAPRDAQLERALSAVMINAASSGAALRQVMQHLATDQHRSVEGWTLETSDIQSIPFGDALLAPGPLRVQIGVTHHKAPGGAWAQYAVLIAILREGSDGSTREALVHSRSAPRSAWASPAAY
jgi:hypothetical protein